VRITFVLLLPAVLALRADEPSFQRTKIDGFYVVGIEARTSNELEMRSKGKIGEIIARVRKEGLLKKLSNRVGNDTYALYTNYKSDRNGPYTYFLGAKVSSTGQVPGGMVVRKVPAGNYAMLTESGMPAANVALRLWQHAWALEDTHQINRAYQTDFEVHHGIDENYDPGGRIDLYVGLKN
jgi:predicted transcriptional regulator YdeE